MDKNNRKEERMRDWSDIGERRESDCQRERDLLRERRERGGE
jgi:hypothetical protein